MGILWAHAGAVECIVLGNFFYQSTSSKTFLDCSTFIVWWYTNEVGKLYHSYVMVPCKQRYYDASIVYLLYTGRSPSNIICLRHISVVNATN